jgi:hypothetical protein
MAMRRRTLLVLASLLVCAALAGLLYVQIFTAASPVRWENVPAIKAGMTRADVEALLGAPPGVYATRAIQVQPFPPSQRPWTLWIGDDRAVCVAFDELESVTDVRPLAVTHTPGSFLHWLISFDWLLHALCC